MRSPRARSSAPPNGTFTFDGSVTGVDAADYLLGAVSVNGSAFQQYSMQVLDSRTRYGGAYAQDSWKVKPNFTLNLGLRWEVSMPWYDTQGKIETIVPGVQSVQFPTAPLGWLVPGDPGIPLTLAPTHYNNWAPRAGLAYSPGFTDGILRKIFGGPGKTSIRASFGIYYTSIEDLNLFYEVGDPPYGNNWQSPNGVLFEEPYRTRTDGVSQGQRFPYVFPVPGSPANKTLNYAQFLPPSYVPGYDIHNRMPYAEHYNFSIQRELSRSTVLTLAYVGTQGHKLISQTDANPGNAAFCQQLNAEGAVDTNTGLSNPACGPGGEQDTYQLPNGTLVHGTRTALGPAFGANNTFTRNSANSNYNSFQATVERKAADMTFLAAYTFGKALDDSSTFGELMNFSNYRLSRGLSTFDVTHNFVVSYNWALPFDRLFSHAPKRLTRDWNITGISRFSTGFPIRISQYRGDLSLTGSNSTDEPNRVGPPGYTGSAFGRTERPQPVFPPRRLHIRHPRTFRQLQRPVLPWPRLSEQRRKRARGFCSQVDLLPDGPALVAAPCAVTARNYLRHGGFLCVAGRRRCSMVSSSPRRVPTFFRLVVLHHRRGGCSTGYAQLNSDHSRLGM